MLYEFSKAATVKRHSKGIRKASHYANDFDSNW